MGDENEPLAANSSLDELVPLQIKSAFDVAEHADPQSDGMSDKPLTERMKASVPAVRKAAFAELGTQLAGKAEHLAADVADLVPAMLHDKAPLCHESALDAAAAWIQSAPASAISAVSSAVAKALVEKHAAGKFQAKAIAALVSLFQAGGADAVNSALAAGLKAKVPKAIASALKASAEVLALCGGGAFDAQPQIKALADMLQHRDKLVRDEATALVGVIRLHYGDGIFKELKSIGDDRIAALKAIGLPEARVMATVSVDAKEGLEPIDTQHAERPTAAATRPTISRPPFDLLAKLPKTKGSSAPADAWEKSLSAEKWVERKKAADTIVELLDGETSVKMSPEFTVVAKGLKKLYGDANVNVVASSIKATHCLTEKLGKEFGSHGKRLAPALLEKGAEKKAAVAEAVRAALAALVESQCLAISDAAEITLGAIKASTNPALRCTAARWLMSAVASAACDCGTLGRTLPTLDSALTLLEEDATVEVRSLAFEATARIAKLLPSDEAQAWMKEMAPKRAERLAKGKAQVGALKDTSRSEANSTTHPSETAPPGRTTMATLAPPVATTQPTRTEASEARSSRTAKQSTEKSKFAAPGAAKTPGWREPELPSADDLHAIVEEHDVPPSALRAAIVDAAWGKRVQAFIDVTAHVRSMSEDSLTPLVVELIMWQISMQLAKEKNEQVMAKSIEAIAAVVLAAPLVSRRSATRALGDIVERLTAKRVKSAATEAILSLAEAVGPTWVVSQLHNRTIGHKNPKVLCEALVALTSAFTAFGPCSLSPAGALGMAIPAMDSRDASVRDAAMKLILTLRRELGSPFLSLPQLNELKDIVKKQLESESASMGDAPQPMTPTRFFKHGTARLPTTGAPANSTPGRAAPAPVGLADSSSFLDDLVPRVDLLRDRVKPGIIAQLRHQEWKERKAALDVVTVALQDAPRLSPVVGPLLEALVPRVSDKQQALATAALNAIGSIGQGVGRAIRPFIRTTLPAVISALGDGKATTRDCALDALNKWVKETSFEPLVPLLPTGMGMESPAGRAKLLTWLAAHVPQLDSACEADPLLPGLLRNLDDRTPEVRAAAATTIQALLATALVTNADLDAQVEKLNPATVKKLTPVLAKLKLAAPQADAPLGAPGLGNAVHVKNARTSASRLSSRSNVEGSTCPVSTTMTTGKSASRPVSLLRSATMGSIPAPRGSRTLEASKKEGAPVHAAKALGNGSLSANRPGPRPATVSPTRSRSTAASPARSRSLAASPARSQSVAASPARPRSVAASPARPRSAAASPVRPRSVTASPAKPRSMTASPARPRSAAAGLAKPRSAAPSPAKPRSTMKETKPSTPGVPRPGSAGIIQGGINTRGKQRETAHKGLTEDIMLLGSQQSTQPDVLKALSLLSRTVADNPDALAAVLEPLAEALATRLRTALRSPSALSQCKKTLQLMIDMLGEPRIVGFLQQPQIRLLVLELLERLLDPCLADFGAEVAHHLLDTLNFIMLKLLQNSPRGPTLSALLQLLGEKGTLPSQGNLSSLVLKCLAKLNKTLKDMAPQIDMLPVVKELSALSWTLAAAERDSPGELITHIRDASDVTLSALVAVRGQEVLNALRMCGEGAGASGRGVSSRRKASPALVHRVNELLGVSCSPRHRVANAASVENISDSTPTPQATSSDAASVTMSLSGGNQAGSATPTRTNARTPVRQRSGTATAQATRKTPNSVRQQRVTDASIADAPAATGGDAAIASAIARLTEMKKKYNIEATPARATRSNTAFADPPVGADVAGDLTVPSTPAELRAVRARLAKHGYVKPGEN